MIERIIDTYEEEEFLKADGFNAAIIGVDEVSMRLIYSVSEVRAASRLERHFIQKNINHPKCFNEQGESLYYLQIKNTRHA